MEQTALRPWRRLSGGALKLIAICTMLIDHIGYTLIWSIYEQSFLQSFDGTGMSGGLSPDQWYNLYLLFRIIGRIAFPIFCFLLVEGFFHTRSRPKYLLRLGAFCLIAEVPFDMAFNDAILEFSYQNVFFTLFLGFCAMCLWDWIKRRWPGLSLGGMALAVTVFGIGASLLHTDYSFFGVLLIMTMALGRDLSSEKGLGAAHVLLGALAILWYCWSKSNWIEIFALAGLLLTLCYNGEKGRLPKYIAYGFYPVHLLILALVTGYLF